MSEVGMPTRGRFDVLNEIKGLPAGIQEALTFGKGL